MTNEFKINPKLDLIFEKTTTLPIEKLWKGWTHPEILMKWFCPKPWKVSDCKMDLRAGGQFFTMMEGPAGERYPNDGCYLEIVENKKLVFTNLMTQDFRPRIISSNDFHFTATVTFSKTDNGTLYRAIGSHADEEGRKKHEQMGFKEGWGMAFDQLVDVMKNQ